MLKYKKQQLALDFILILEGRYVHIQVSISNSFCNLVSVSAFFHSGASRFQSDQYCLCIGYTGSVVFSGIFTVLSQPGSPTAGGAVGDGAAPTQAVGGLAVALKMVAAAEQAKNWWKLLPKPPVFDHATRERQR